MCIVKSNLFYGVKIVRLLQCVFIIFETVSQNLLSPSVQFASMLNYTCALSAYCVIC